MEKYETLPKIGIIEAVRNGLYEKFSFDLGRSRRSEFWWFALFYVVCNFILGVILAILPVELSLLKYVCVFISIYLFAALSFAYVRRMHDSGRSGNWWLLLLAGNICSGILGIAISLLPLIAITCYIIAIILGCLDSEKGDNDYGETTKYVVIENENNIT